MEMGKKLRMAMIGGGEESWMGPVHRAAAAATGKIDFVTGAFGSTRQRSYDSANAMGMPPGRTYGAYRDMLRRESHRAGEAEPDFVSIVAPNSMHYPIAMAAFDSGFHVITEAPMTTNLDEALNLKRKMMDVKRELCVTYTYSAFPMIRQARVLLRRGAIGNLRKIVLSYPMGWLAQRLETQGNRHASWRTDQRRCGLCGSMMDVGMHCAHLLEFLAGVPLREVNADLHTFVAGRMLDDDSTAMVRLDKNIKGLIIASQVSTGPWNRLKIDMYGDKGALFWRLDRPDLLAFHGVEDDTKVMQAKPGPADAIKVPAGVTLPLGLGEPYFRALVSIYDTFADRLLALKRGEDPGVAMYPQIDEGIRATAFLEAVYRNVKGEPAERWTPLVFQPMTNALGKASVQE
jgi:predicted dehydrogenase